ncbi:MAG: inositol monophosphatase [Acidimicrobiia bacterium]|nr:inositol monophosphatase [Acidimicrobiia bacterium]
MEPDALIEMFGDVCEVITRAVNPITGADRRARTDRPGQYAIDVVADQAALAILGGREITVVSEESGVSGPPKAPITVVIDPIDGSSNASRNIPYWATSLCALDREGPLVAMVVNHATCVVYSAVRGQGAYRDDVKLTASDVTRTEDAFIGLSTFPNRMLQWKQFRALGSCALALCDVAAGVFDGYFDGGSVHAPWDYLGGYLMCLEAGATVVDLQDRPLGIGDPNARRHLVAAGTPALLDALRKAAG